MTWVVKLNDSSPRGIIYRVVEKPGRPYAEVALEQDAEFAASLGLPFAIKRGTPETLAFHISSRLRPEQRTVTLELGGGTVAFPEDVALGVELITNATRSRDGHSK